MTKPRYKAPGFTTLAVTALASLVAASAIAFSNPVELRVDGQPVLSDVPPVRAGHNGVYVPLRALSDALGGDTHYEARSGEVIVSRGDRTMHVKAGATNAVLDGKRISVRQAPFRVRGRVMVSLRAVQRLFGVIVSYDKTKSRVDVNTLGTAQSSESSAP